MSVKLPGHLICLGLTVGVGCAAPGSPAHMPVMGLGRGPLQGQPASRVSAMRALPGGSTRRTLSLPQHPFALAFDVPTHRLLTLNGVSMQMTDGATRFRLDSVSVLDPSSGAQRTVPFGGYALSDRGVLAVDARDGQVYVPVRGRDLAAPGTLLAFDGWNGALLRRLPLGHAPQDLVIDAGTRRIFVSEIGDVRVFDAGTGRLLRVIGPGGRIGPTLLGGAMALDTSHARVFVVNGPGVPSRVVSVVALSARTGAVLWSAPMSADTPMAGIRSLAVDERLSRVVTGGDEPNTRSGRVHVLDARTGRPLASVDLGVSYDIVSVAVDVATGHAFAAASSDSSSPAPVEVSLLETLHGRLLRTTNVALPASGLAYPYQRVSGVAVDGRRGYLFVGIDQAGFGNAGYASYVGVLSTRSADVLRRLRVGVGPSRLALDAQAGRLYVSNYADKSVSVIDETHL